MDERTASWTYIWRKPYGRHSQDIPHRSQNLSRNQDLTSHTSKPEGWTLGLLRGGEKALPKLAWGFDRKLHPFLLSSVQDTNEASSSVYRPTRISFGAMLAHPACLSSKP